VEEGREVMGNEEMLVLESKKERLDPVADMASGVPGNPAD